MSGLSTLQVCIVVLGVLAFFGMLMFFVMMSQAADAGIATTCIEQGMEWIEEECRR